MCIGQTQGNMQPIERAGRRLLMQSLQLADLFFGHFGVGNRPQRGEEIGHESWLAGRPLPLERPLHGLKRLVGMWAGLVFQFRRAALDHKFQHIERTLIDIRLRPIAHL